MCMSHVARAQPNVNVCREAVCVTNGTCLSLCGLSLCAPRAFGCAGNARQPSARLARYKAELRVLYDVDDMRCFASVFFAPLFMGAARPDRRVLRVETRRDETREMQWRRETGRQRRARPRAVGVCPPPPPAPRAGRGRGPRHPPPRAPSPLSAHPYYLHSRSWTGQNVEWA